MTIKEFRLSQGLSQPKLAKALGIGVSTVGGYEAGRIKPSEKVIAKIKEVFDVDLNEAAPAADEPAVFAAEEKAAKPKRTRKKKEAASEATVAEPAVFAVEEKAAKPKRTRKKKEAAAEAAPAEPVPAVEKKVEETPAKPKRGRKKKEVAAEAAPAAEPVAEEKTEEAPAKPKRGRKKKDAAPVPATEEKAEKAAKKPRGRKKKEQPVDESLLQMQSDAEAAVHALFNEKSTVIIQSPMGGEITPEEVLAKVGPVDKVYVRVDLNTAFWVRGEESGAVNLW